MGNGEGLTKTTVTRVLLLEISFKRTEFSDTVGIIAYNVTVDTTKTIFSSNFITCSSVTMQSYSACQMQCELPDYGKVKGEL